jgi:hypothetical protein
MSRPGLTPLLQRPGPRSFQFTVAWFREPRSLPEVLAAAASPKIDNAFRKDQFGQPRVEMQSLGLLRVSFGFVMKVER